MSLAHNIKRLFFFVGRYAMGTDYKLYKKFIYTYRSTYPELAKIVKQWRFHYFKPHNISKAEQQ